MILTCPVCSKRYLVDGKSFSPQGRQVRCVACGHQWTQKPVEEEVSLSGPSLLSSWERERDQAGGFLEKKEPSGTRWGWFLLMGVVGICLGALVVGRASLCSVFPKLYPFYQAIGLPVEPVGHGLKIQNLTTEISEKEGEKVLTIKGEIWNTLDQVRPLPPLHVTYLSSGACEAKGRIFQMSPPPEKGAGACYSQRWTFVLPQDRLMPGEKIWFHTPPQSAPPAETEGYVHF